MGTSVICGASRWPAAVSIIFIPTTPAVSRKSKNVIFSSVGEGECVINDGVEFRLIDIRSI